MDPSKHITTTFFLKVIRSIASGGAQELDRKKNVKADEKIMVYVLLLVRVGRPRRS